MKGRVLHFDRLKGFGHILPDDDGDDLFFHMTCLVGTRRVDRGQEVEYELGTNPRSGNVMAVRVTPVFGGGHDERQ
jgi:cold shock CspA family protein